MWLVAVATYETLSKQMAFALNGDHLWQFRWYVTHIWVVIKPFPNESFICRCEFFQREMNLSFCNGSSTFAMRARTYFSVQEFWYCRWPSRCIIYCRMLTLIWNGQIMWNVPHYVHIIIGTRLSCARVPQHWKQWSLMNSQRKSAVWLFGSQMIFRWIFINR